MARQKKSKIVSVITWLLLLLMFAGCIGAVCYFASIGKDDITNIVSPSFCIEYDGKVYKTDTENVVDLSQSGNAVFKVKNGGQYSVKIMPYSSYYFTFNGEKRVLGKDEDITEFLIDSNEVCPEYFVINCNNDFLLKKAIEKMLGTSGEYSFSDNAYDFCLNLFITSESGEIITIKISQFLILLNRYEIIF